MATWPIVILAILFVVVCVLMILVILIQKPRGGGLAGAFGGGGGSAQSVFGSKTGDIATWFTVAMFVCFILLAMGMQWTIRPADSGASPPTQDTTQTPQPPADSPADPASTDPQPDPTVDDSTEQPQ